MTDRSLLFFQSSPHYKRMPIESLSGFCVQNYKSIRAHWALPKSIPVIVPASVDESCAPARLLAHGSSQDSGETISPMTPSFSESPFASSSLSSFTSLIDLLLNFRRFFKSPCVESCFCEAVPSSWKPWRRDPWAPGGEGGGHHEEGGGAPGARSSQDLRSAPHGTKALMAEPVSCLPWASKDIHKISLETTKRQNHNNSKDWNERKQLLIAESVSCHPGASKDIHNSNMLPGTKKCQNH